MKRLALVLLLAGATPALAQEQKATPDANPITGANRHWYSETRDYLIRAAEQMPEADYGFQPTKEVRTFGQIIGHVASAHYMFCAAALQEKPPVSGETELEKLTTKAELVKALKESSAYCDKAYETVTDATAGEPVKLFGQTGNRASALILNTSHDSEHYGNLVTYMRIKGMVPPSSQPSSN